MPTQASKMSARASGMHFKTLRIALALQETCSGLKEGCLGQKIYVSPLRYLFRPMPLPHKSGKSDNSEPLCRNGSSFGVYRPNRFVGRSKYTEQLRTEDYICHKELLFRTQ